MSYCRWSSDNGRCDVYVYEDVSGGWTTHVAKYRKMFPPVPDIMFCRISKWLCKRSGPVYHKKIRRTTYEHQRIATIYKAWLRFAILWQRYVHRPSLRLIPMRPIGLPHDGESFNDKTPGDCANRLEYLRELGYKVPQHAIDALREEADEQG